MGNNTSRIVVNRQYTHKVPFHNSLNNTHVSNPPKLNIGFRHNQDMINHILNNKQPIYPWANTLHKVIEKINNEKFWEYALTKYNINLIDVTNRVGALGIVATRVSQALHEKRHPEEVFWRDGLNWFSSLLIPILVKKNIDKITEKFIFNQNELDTYTLLLNKIPNLTINTRKITFKDFELTSLQENNILDRIQPLFNAGPHTINGNYLNSEQVNSIKEVDKILQAKLYKLNNDLKDLFDKEEILKKQDDIISLNRLKKKVSSITDKLEWKSIKAPDWKRIDAEIKTLEETTSSTAQKFFQGKTINLKEIVAQIVDLKTKSFKESRDILNLKELEQLETLHQLKRFNKQVFVGNIVSTIIGLSLMILMGGIIIPKFVFRYLVPKEDRVTSTNNQLPVKNKLSEAVQKTIRIINQDIMINR